MSHLHFTATEKYRKRVIQLGEAPQTVYHVGALGLDAVANCEMLDRDSLAKQLGITWQQQNILVTFHPVTLDKDEAETQVSALLDAIRQFPDLGVLFTMPNADPESAPIRKYIERFIESEPDRTWGFSSLGQQRYFSALKVVDAVVGNSSSGLIEAPAFGIPTVNIGDRQKGRDCGPSVIHCSCQSSAIVDAMYQAFSKEGRQIAATSTPVYGTAGAARKAVNILQTTSLQGILKKSFFDIEFNV